MANSIVTAAAVLVAMLVLLLIAATGKPKKSSSFTAAIVGFGYGILMLTGLTGAGLDLLRAIFVLVVSAAAYPVAVIAKRRITAVNSRIRVLVGLLLATALLSALAQSLSLLGWVYVATAVIGLAAASAVFAIVGGDRGVRRINTWALWITLVSMWGVTVVLLFRYSDLLFNPILQVSDIPVQSFVAIAVVIVFTAFSDPLLRRRIGSADDGFPFRGLVVAILLLLGMMLAALLFFGGAFFAPGVLFFTLFPYVSSLGPLGILPLVLGILVVVTIIPGYLNSAAQEFTPQKVKPDSDHAQPNRETVVAIVAITIAAAGLALLIPAPTPLLVVAGVLSAAAVGSTASSDVRRQTAATVVGALAGLGVGSLFGVTELFTMSWGTVVAVAVALIAANITGRCISNDAISTTPTNAAAEDINPVI